MARKISARRISARRISARHPQAIWPSLSLVAFACALQSNAKPLICSGSGQIPAECPRGTRMDTGKSRCATRDDEAIAGTAGFIMTLFVLQESSAMRQGVDAGDMIESLKSLGERCIFHIEPRPAQAGSRRRGAFITTHPTNQRRVRVRVAVQSPSRDKRPAFAVRLTTQVLK
jgi:hypothetical protein